MRIPSKAPERLPNAAFRDVHGTSTTLRRGRGPRFVMAVHSLQCATCRQYVESLVAAAPQQEWGGALYVIVPGAIDPARSIEGVNLLADPEHAFAKGNARVAIADEWGEAYFDHDAGAMHDLPDPAEVTEWFRFIAIQCPECEGPEGAWRTL